MNARASYPNAVKFVESLGADAAGNADDLVAMFSSIWLALGNGEHAKVKECIGNLAGYMHTNPGIDIEPYLLKATPWFKKYLLSQLRKGAEDARQAQPAQGVATPASTPAKLREADSATAPTAALDVSDIRSRMSKLTSASSTSRHPSAAVENTPSSGLAKIRARMAKMG